MLKVKKRINKCVYYFLNYKSFQVKIETIRWFKDFITFLKENFSDLEMSWEEVDAFYCGLKYSPVLENNFKRRPEYCFYLAGQKLKNEIGKNS
jgi:hypothetical protein